MKTKLITVLLAAAALVPARAQLFSPEALHGAAWGGFIGGMLGGDTCRPRHHYHHRFSGEGAAIGAGVGLLAGVLAGEARRQEYSYGQPYVSAPAPRATVGYGYAWPGASSYVYYAPNAYTAPGYSYRPARPNYALGGTLLGAASGALIGAGSDRPGEGAAIGAATGLVLGSIAEGAARERGRLPVVTVQATSVPTPTATPRPETQAQPQNQPTSQPCADSTYHWTPRPQISDAPRVPDAPKF